MIRGGLVSVSFRDMSPADIVELVATSGLEGIEWGGDVHVPHGDLQTAREVRALTRDHGLCVASYGSYYRAGDPAGNGSNPEFDAVLDTAQELQAPVIRVWCGSKASADAGAGYRQSVMADLNRIGEKALKQDVAIACEFHGNTLTDTNGSALAMYSALATDNVLPYWQPPVGQSVEHCRSGLRGLLPTLCNLHLFYWEDVSGQRQRRSLAEGRELLVPFLQMAASTGRSHWALLEFVKDNAPKQFLDDAATLKTWIEELQGHLSPGQAPPRKRNH